MVVGPGTSAAARSSTIGRRADLGRMPPLGPEPAGARAVESRPGLRRRRQVEQAGSARGDGQWRRIPARPSPGSHRRRVWTPTASGSSSPRPRRESRVENRAWTSPRWRHRATSRPWPNGSPRRSRPKVRQGALTSPTAPPAPGRSPRTVADRVVRRRQTGGRAGTAPERCRRGRRPLRRADRHRRRRAGADDGRARPPPGPRSSGTAPGGRGTSARAPSPPSPPSPRGTSSTTGTTG